jgi:hypothetical protein
MQQENKMAGKSSTNENNMQSQDDSMDESAESKLNTQPNPQSENEGIEEPTTNYEEIFENANREQGELF